MKTALLTGLALFATAHMAQAQVLACDDFSYPDGALVPNGGWVNHSGTAGTLLVANGAVVVDQGSPSEDANLPFTPVAGILYYGVDFSVDDLGAPYAGTDHEYFVHFKDAAFGFCARLDVVAPTGLGDFSVGISSDSSTADAIWATDLTFGMTYRAIVKYDQDLNIATLWIDAALETDPSLVGFDQPDPGDAVTSIALRQSWSSGANEIVRVDNLVVGQTFADVLSASCGGGPTGPGTAYCFGDGSGTLCPCGNPGAAGEGCANGTGAGAIVNGTGSASIAAGDLVLHGTQLPGGQPGLMFQANNSIAGGMGSIFGDGLRCAGGSVIRLEVLFIDGTGHAMTSINVGAAGLVAPGDVRRYQLWYRDPAGTPCGSSFNLSNGYEITWM